MHRHRLCPWWLGYLLASPVRRLWHDPGKILSPYVREGMVVIEPGPGMGFFTLELLRRVGPSGRVVAVELQPRMLKVLRRRALDAGLYERLDSRQAEEHSLNLSDLESAADFALVFAVAHEVADAGRFFSELSHALKPNARALLVEPRPPVGPDEFEEELRYAAAAGLVCTERPQVSLSAAAVLEKSTG
ncbi:MAG: class I SAM-dependent methyltransferase [bacterium]|jgi:SAM-dependent methyltransferase